MKAGGLTERHKEIPGVVKMSILIVVMISWDMSKLMKLCTLNIFNSLQKKKTELNTIVKTVEGKRDSNWDHEKEAHWAICLDT